jgi:hypothetical protein
VAITGDIGRLVIRRSGVGPNAANSSRIGQCDSSGFVTFSPIAGGEHVFDGAFPQLFGWLLQSGQMVGGELYQGSGARKFQWLSINVEIFQDWLLHSAADRNAELPVYGRDPFLALRHFIEPPSSRTLLTAP